MKNDPFNDQPSALPDAELEARLGKVLARLPDAPVPSNFTARVMQAIELEEARNARPQNRSWNWRLLFPRVAFAMVAVVFAGLVFQQHELTANRTALARSVAMVTGTQPLPSVEALKNFDAIQRMSQPAHADEELLALLQ